jgi:hypothetical protein
MPPHFMGEDPSIFYNGMHDYNAQSAPWVSSHFFVDMPSHMQTPPWSTYMNPSIGLGGTITPMPTSSFDMSRVPMGGWDLPPYGSNPSYSLSGSSAQMGAYYTLPMYLLSAMSVPLNTFSAPGPQVPPGLPYGDNQFYNSGYPPYGTHSQGSNIYPHSNNSYPTSVSLQTSMMMPIQTSSDHLGINHHVSGPGQGVYQDPFCPAMFQNQSFLGPWNQIPQSIASPTTVSHTSAPSPTSASHVGDESTLSTNHVDNLLPTSANYVGGTILFTPDHSRVTSLTPIHHT